MNGLTPQCLLDPITVLHLCGCHITSDLYKFNWRNRKDSYTPFILNLLPGGMTLVLIFAKNNAFIQFKKAISKTIQHVRKVFSKFMIQSLHKVHIPSNSRGK